MACLLKRGGVWTVRVFLEGRNRWRSLRTGDRQEAERGAREIEAAIKGQQWVRSQLDELLARATREARPDEAPLLCESVAAALWRLLELVPADRRDPLAPALSRSLVEQQRRKLALADGWFHELDESAVLTYADDLWAAQLTPRTFNAHVPFLRSLWGTLRVAAGLGTDNPWAGFKAKAATADTGRRNLT